MAPTGTGRNVRFDCIAFSYQPVGMCQVSEQKKGPAGFPAGPFIPQIWRFTSKFEPGFHAPYPGFVDEPGEVVKINAAHGRRIVGDIPDERRNVEPVGLVTNP